MLNQFLIKKPIITEKAAMLARYNKYVFEVRTGASSAEIKKLLKHIYNVDALRVNIVNVPEKIGRYGRAKKVKRPSFKKAIVTLKTGQTLDIIPS